MNKCIWILNLESLKPEEIASANFSFVNAFEDVGHKGFVWITGKLSYIEKLQHLVKWNSYSLWQILSQWTRSSLIQEMIGLL